jgi:uncharacterized protein HemX
LVKRTFRNLTSEIFKKIEVKETEVLAPKSIVERLQDFALMALILIMIASVVGVAYWYTVQRQRDRLFHHEELVRIKLEKWALLFS